MGLRILGFRSEFQQGTAFGVKRALESRVLGGFGFNGFSVSLGFRVQCAWFLAVFAEIFYRFLQR